MRRLMARLFQSFALYVLTCAVAWGQGGTAQISGTVTDPSGAAMPGVEITATQTDTGVSRTTLSNEVGLYELPSLPIGPYRLEASLPGFRKFVQTGIGLQVNSNPAIKITLELGQVTETIEVQANAAMVETRSTGVGSVMENARILELPLIGRQVADLVVLSGAANQVAVANTNSRGGYPGTPTFSIAGGLSTGNTITLDSGMHNDIISNTSLPLPFPDALQEFKVETSSLPAQYGFHAGATVSAVTKAGTNEFHGALFEFVRNYKFNSRSFFAPTRDSLKRNQFGGTLGGPILRNKLFFFGGYQGTITRQDATGSRAFVPTAAMLAGDFRAIASPACNAGRQITLLAPFVNNQIDPSLLSRAAVNLAKRLPTPIDQCGLVQYGPTVRSQDRQVVAKIDYNRSSTHSIFGRYVGNHYEQPTPAEISKNPLDSGQGESEQIHSTVLGDTYLFGSSTVNTFRLTWNHTSDLKKLATLFGASDLGINIYSYPSDFISVSATGGFSTGGNAGHWRADAGSIGDDVSVVRGNHQMSFGANFLTWKSNNDIIIGTNGQFSFTGVNTGLGLADLMVGKLAQFVQTAPNLLDVRDKYIGTYGQDSWKLKPWLMLSYGLRWEPFFPQQFGALKESNTFSWDAFKQGIKTTQFVNAPPGMFYPGDPQFGSNGTSPITNKWKHFAPRVGLTWDPTKDGKTVVRAGYGIFYDMYSVEWNTSIPQSFPWGGKVTLINPVGGFDDPWRSQPGGNPFPFVISKNAPYVNNGAYTDYKAGTTVPYVNQRNLGIQRQIGTNWLVSVSYIGSTMVHMASSKEENPGIFFPGNPVNGVCTAQGYVFRTTTSPCSTTGNTNQRRISSLLDPIEGPKLANIVVLDDGGTRSYNGLLVSAEKRFSQGFSATANYTWSHCISDATPTGTWGATRGGSYMAPTRKGDRGNCGVNSANGGGDIRHIANATFLYNMPRFSNTVLNALASNWRVSGILKAKSGLAFTVFSGTDRMLNGVNAGGQYVNKISDQVYGNKCKDGLLGTNPACLWLNASAFAAPDLGTLGNLGHNTVFGPGPWNLDTGLARVFNLKETQKLEFRAEATNVLNHANFNAPSGNLGSAQFGRIQSAQPGRVMQFALKYLF